MSAIRNRPAPPRQVGGRNAGQAFSLARWITGTSRPSSVATATWLILPACTVLSIRRVENGCWAHSAAVAIT